MKLLWEAAEEAENHELRVTGIPFPKTLVTPTGTVVDAQPYYPELTKARGKQVRWRGKQPLYLNGPDVDGAALGIGDVAAPAALPLAGPRGADAVVGDPGGSAGGAGETVVSVGGGKGGGRAAPGDAVDPRRSAPLPPPEMGNGLPTPRQFYCPGEAPPGYCWVLAEPLSGMPIGSKVGVGRGDILLSPTICMIEHDGDWGKAEMIPNSAHENYANFRREHLGLGKAPDRKPVVPDEPPPKRSALEDAMDPDGGDGGGGSSDSPHKKAEGYVEAVSNEDDCRVLFIDYDGQGNRFKDWRTVCYEITSASFDDFPIEGGLNSIHMCQVMQRRGGDPILWLEKWAHKKGIADNDRVYHELEVICSALYYMGTYDQLNLGMLASAETLIRRISSIVSAYANPSKPNWNLAKHLKGEADVNDVIAPGLMNFAVKKAKDEIDIGNAGSRSTAGSSGDGRGQGQGGQGGDGGGNPAKADANKNAGGKGAKGRGRGLQAPAPGQG